MSWGLFFELLVDRLKSAGVPSRRGASLAATDRQADRDELRRLIVQHTSAWRDFGHATSEARVELALRIAEDAGVPRTSLLTVPVASLVLDLVETEPGFMPFVPPADIAALSALQIGELKQDLRHRIAFLSDDETFEAAILVLLRLVNGFINALPASVLAAQVGTAAPFTTEALQLVDKPHDLMDGLIGHFLADREMQELGLFLPLCRQLYRNGLEASGVLIDPDQPLFAQDTAKPVYPSDCKSEPLPEIAERYFRHTPFEKLLAAPVPFDIPQKVRFEHLHMLAGTGHGKTQTLQHLIVQDLLRSPEDVPSMVILDSQGDMLDRLSHLPMFDPVAFSGKVEPGFPSENATTKNADGSLARRLLIVDPSDVAFAPALNLFDIRSERLADYSQRDREQVLAGIIEIYDYVFSGLLGAELTQKQSMVFRFLVQLMLAIPGATIHTLRDLLIDASPFMPYVARLPDTARGFFETQFFSKGYAPTREQVLRRLYGVLQNPSFERMFAIPHNRLDLFDTLNSGGIVLVNTAKDFMKSEASGMFGRFIIALTLKAAIERAILREDQRRPTFLWIDEASEYFDDKIDDLLIQARKYRLGLVMAHQYLGQLPRGLPASIMTNTSIKLAGGLSDQDARAMSREMRTTPEFINALRKGQSETSFAAYVRNVTPQALKLTIPFGTAENMGRMPELHFEMLRDISRRRLSVPPQLPQPEPPSPVAPAAPMAPAVTIPRQEDEFWEGY